MSRALTDVVKAYYNMDIENMPDEKSEKLTGGLLAKPKSNKFDSEIDISNPVVRVAKQMKVIRDFREEIKNG